MISKNIRQLGIELEGGWHGGNDYSHIKEDSSVEDMDEDDYIVGEIALPPFSDLPSLMSRLQSCWPDEWNDSCGMHMHMELSSLGWMVLGTEEAYRSFYEALQAYAKRKFDEGDESFYEARRRLDGDHKYCSDLFMIEQALVGGEDCEERYYALNAQSYYNHGTLEFRSWPQTDFAAGSLMVRSLVRIVESTITKFKDMDIVDYALENGQQMTAPEFSLPSFREVKRAAIRPRGRSGLIDPDFMPLPNMPMPNPVPNREWVSQLVNRIEPNGRFSSGTYIDDEVEEEPTPTFTGLFSS